MPYFLLNMFYPMKILIINTLYYPNVMGGAERSVQFLAESLFHNGIDVVVISLSMNNEDHIAIIGGVKVYYLKHRNFFNRFSSVQYKTYQYLFWHILDSFNPFLAATVDRIIRIEKPDIINTHNISGFSPSVWLSPRRYGIPIVHTIRDYYLLCPHSSMFKNGSDCKKICLNCAFLSLPKKLLSRYVDAVTAISHFVIDKHLIFGYFPFSKKRKVIYNSYEKTAVMNWEPTGSNRPLTFGFLGRLHAKKGIELFLNSFSQIKSEKIFAFVGGQGHIDYMHSLVKRYSQKNIIFKGWVEPDHFFQDIDVLVVPSIWNEPLGRVAIEAFAHGKPVIAAKRGGLQELIDEGKTGFLFDPDIEGDLFLKVKFFVDHPELSKEMGNYALIKAISYSHSKMVESYINIYNELLVSSVARI